jgi:predicted Ser/Thr protein kinase
MGLDLGVDGLLGRVVGGYRIESVIGRGGMGVVFRAVQIGLHRPVALKIIAPGLAADEAFRTRFQRESEIAAALEHPHVVPIHEAGEADGMLFISMRYVEGTDLRAAIRAEGALAPERAALIVSQVASALDAAHARGLVHRDVKPANILLGRSETDHAYLTDFGVVKQVDTTTSADGITQPGEFVGTVSYVAPEQLLGEAVDGRADIYSLGCVLHEALTGEAPFGRRSQVALMFAHIHLEPTLPSTRRPELSTRFDRCVSTALRKSPDDRFQTAGQLARCATTAVAGRVVDGPDLFEDEETQALGGAPRPPPRAERKPSRQRRTWVLLAGVVTLAAAAAGAAVLLVEDDDRRTVARTPPPGDRTPLHVVDRIDVGATVTAVGKGRSFPPPRQAFLGARKDVVQIDTRTRRKEVLATLDHRVRQIVWGKSQKALWVRTRGLRPPPDFVSSVYLLNPYRPGWQRRVSVVGALTVVARPDGSAAVVRLAGDGLRLAWFDRHGHKFADRPLPVSATDPRFATNGGTLFVGDTQRAGVSAVYLGRPGTPARRLKVRRTHFPGVTIAMVVGGAPERLWVLAENKAGTRSVIALDDKTLKQIGKPVRVPFPTRIINGDTTVYFYRRGRGVERPTVGQIDTARHVVVRPLVPIRSGVTEVGASAGYVWVGNDPDTTVTRLK